MRSPLLCSFILLLLILPGSIYSQSPRTYTSQQYNLDLSVLDSSFSSALSLLERESSASYFDGDADEVTIPVVFHVLHTSVLDRVDEAQIRSQIEILNQDFSTLNIPDEDPRDPSGTFRDLAATPGIKFCSPVTGPGGELSTGINFRIIPLTLLDDLIGIKESLFGIAPWNAQHYLNVWIVDLPEGVGGFAQMPGGNPLTDGIVIDPQYIGLRGTTEAPYDQGRTLTHLIGNYLGLKDIWSQGGCSDDGVSDTPVHNAPNVGVPGRGHTSTCDGYPAEMSMNFMDNTDDAGVYMFTKGQVKRMRWVLSEQGLRSNLSQTETECGGEDFTYDIAEKISTPTTAPPISLNLKAWPNPAQENFTINVNSSGLSGEDKQVLQVFNLNGSVVHQETIAGAEVPVSKMIDASTWVPGIYLVKVTAGNESKTTKIIIQ